eukprot:TRINITY_DN1903_c0_g2_i1.p1 TRINITY_DN1903_c0_g2~~TRINITY_DN1903_c0_g2_i1.p1  ORF type:complete len:949 (+),score=211.77 TRINITY_DN1903_c0_g2_i1:132-2978(+)
MDAASEAASEAEGMERKTRLLGLKTTEIRRFERMFRVFDRDGDGSIGASELQELMKSVGHAVGKDKAIDMIKEIDGDGSGRVEFKEFLSLMMEDGSSLRSWEAVIVMLGEDPDWNKRQMQARQKVKAALEMSRVRPESLTRILADFAVALAATYFFIVVLLEDVGKAVDEYTPAKIAIEAVATALFVAEILVTLNTAVSNKGGRLCQSRNHIVQTYLHSRHVYVDPLSLLPLDLFVPVYPVNRVLRHFRIVKVLKLPTLFKIENTGLMSPAYVQLYFRIVPLFVGVMYCVLVLHALAVGWMLVNGGSDYSYLRALYFILYTLTTAGYGDVDVGDGWPMVYACLLLVVGIVLNGLSIGYLTSFVMRSDIEGDKVDKMRQTLAVLRHFQVPSFLQEEIMSYQYHVLDRNLGIAYTDVIAGLPVAMQQQVSLYMRVRMVSQVPMFSDCELSVQVALAQSLKNSVLPPDEYIMLAGEDGSEMFFLSHGYCDVLAPGGKHLATVVKGGFFGEVALLIDTKRHTNVIALTFCDLFILERFDFNIILDSYPTFAKHIQEELETTIGAGCGGETAALALVEDDTASVLSVLRARSEPQSTILGPSADPAGPAVSREMSVLEKAPEAVASPSAVPEAPDENGAYLLSGQQPRRASFDGGDGGKGATSVRSKGSRGSFTNLEEDRDPMLSRQKSSLAVNGVFEMLRGKQSRASLGSGERSPRLLARVMSPKTETGSKRSLRRRPNPLEGIPDEAEASDSPLVRPSTGDERPLLRGMRGNMPDRMSRSNLHGNEAERPWQRRRSINVPVQSPFPIFGGGRSSVSHSVFAQHTNDDDLASEIVQLRRMMQRMMQLDTQRYERLLSAVNGGLDMRTESEETLSEKDQHSQASTSNLRPLLSHRLPVSSSAGDAASAAAVSASASASASATEGALRIPEKGKEPEKEEKERTAVFINLPEKS